MNGQPTLPWERWRHWALAAHPGGRLQSWLEGGELDSFPELRALVGVPQDPTWHPEGDVWIHTRLVCDQAAEIATRDGLEETARVELLLGALCHDLGKPATTCLRNGRWSAPGHPAAGLEPTERWLGMVGTPPEVIAVVRCLVAEHLAHVQTEMGTRALRRMLVRLRPASLEQLLRLIEADLSGRPPLPRGLPPEVVAWGDRAREQWANGLPPESPAVAPALIQGRHLIALGQAPAPWFREILDTCHAAQLAGEFRDEAEGVRYLRALMQRRQNTAAVSTEGEIKPTRP
jgi:tRNA nucleotidyltransferase (CCA-adding enzyme)